MCSRTVVSIAEYPCQYVATRRIRVLVQSLTDFFTETLVFLLCSSG
jgi:hypothetical protein